MYHDVLMRRLVEATEFWSHEDAVRATSSSTACEVYEFDLIAEALRLADSSDDLMVHVVGVGAGRELATIRRLAPTAVIRAFDIAEPMVAVCRERAQAEGLDVEVSTRPMSSLTSSDGPADVMVSLGAVLGCITPASERSVALRGAHQTLRPGGVLAIVVNQRRGRPDWAVWFGFRDLLVRPFRVGDEAGDRYSGPTRRSSRHHHFTRRELRRVLRSEGFEVAEMGSLRSRLRGHGRRPPPRSPNPLVCLAIRG